MGNIGRKGKGRCSGTILAGAFTVPTVMSAVQQNVVSANLYGANMPKGLTTAVSKSYAKGVSTKYLTKFLRFTTYVFLPVCIAVLTLIGLYKFCVYLAGNSQTLDNVNDEENRNKGNNKIDGNKESNIIDGNKESNIINENSNKNGQYSYWGFLCKEKKEVPYNQALLGLFSVLSEIGPIKTEIEVDSDVLLKVLSEENEEAKPLLKGAGVVTVCAVEVRDDGSLCLKIKGGKLKKPVKIYTKCFTNENIPGVIKFLNKIFEKNNNQNKLTIEENNEAILLKLTRANTEETMVVDLVNGDINKKKEIIELFNGDVGYGSVLNEKYEPDYHENLEGLFKFFNIYGQESGLVGSGKEVKVKSKFLLGVLESSCDNKVKDLLKAEEEVNVCITGVFVSGYLELEIRGKNARYTVGATTKYFSNDIPGVVNFFNKFFEQSNKGNKSNINVALEGRDDGIFLKAINKETEDKLCEVKVSAENFNEFNPEKVYEITNMIDIEEDYWNVLCGDTPYGYNEKQKAIFKLIEEWILEPELAECKGVCCLGDMLSVEVNPNVLLKVLDKDSIRRPEVKTLLEGKEKVTVSIKGFVKEGKLRLEIKGKDGTEVQASTKYFFNNTYGIIKFFNKFLNRIVENTANGFDMFALEKESENIFLHVKGSRPNYEDKMDIEKKGELEDVFVFSEAVFWGQLM